jgi:hypothetical protein
MSQRREPSSSRHDAPRPVDAENKRWITEGAQWKVAHSEEIRAIQWRSGQREFNRTLPAEWIERLDPGGHHLIVPIMAHEHAGGRSVEPHLRARVLLKLKDRGADDPAVAHLDMTYEDFNALVALERDASTLSEPGSDNHSAISHRNIPVDISLLVDTRPVTSLPEERTTHEHERISRELPRVPRLGR